MYQKVFFILKKRKCIEACELGSNGAAFVSCFCDLPSLVSEGSEVRDKDTKDE
jgi:hypothetical protein